MLHNFLSRLGIYRRFANITLYYYESVYLDITTKDSRLLLLDIRSDTKGSYYCLVSTAFYPDNRVFFSAVSLSFYHLVMIVFPLYFSISS